MANPVQIGKAYESVSTAESSERGAADRHGIVTSRALLLVAAVSIVLLLLFSLLSGSTSAGGDAGAVQASGPGIAVARSGDRAESEKRACSVPLDLDYGRTSEEEEDPAVGQAAPGQRVRMSAFKGLEYQLFLPATWTESGSDSYPVAVFLHGAGDGKFSVMNSQSLPRLLAPDQSTSFDPRHCWCLDAEFARVTAMRESPPGSRDAFLDETEDLRSPLADCDFAATFGAIVVMPQGWLPQLMTGWTEDLLHRVEELTQSVLQTYRGDPTRVTLTGQSAGGGGAWSFALMRPQLWAAVNIVCAPAPPSVARELEGVHLWIVGWTGDGFAGNDEVVEALKRRRSGTVRYTRYVKAPAPPDPLYRDMLNHASYDLIYRDPRLWAWAFAQRNPQGQEAWKKET